MNVGPTGSANFPRQEPLRPPPEGGGAADEGELQPAYEISLSPEAAAETARPRDPAKPEGKPPPGAAAVEALSAEEQSVVNKLQARDRVVRAHEAAHQASGAGFAGAASFSFQTGPDGKQYAVGGEVPIRLSSGRTPEETISNAAQVRAAALAPADPSAQDLAVAAMASQMEAQARREKAEVDRLMLEAQGDPAKAREAAAKGGAPAAPAPEAPSAAVAAEG